MQHLNLLPWRQEKRHQQIKIWLFLFAINLSMALALMAGLRHQNQQKQQAIQSILQTSQQDKQKLAHIQQELLEIRRSFQQEQQLAMLDSTQVKIFLQLLTNLTFREGGLSKVSIENQQIILQGLATSQQEFDDIEKYLRKDLPLKHLTLTDFHTQQTHIFFTFTFFLDAPKND